MCAWTGAETARRKLRMDILIHDTYVIVDRWVIVGGVRGGRRRRTILGTPSAPLAASMLWAASALP